MKKAFTLSEILVSLTILGVIMAITIPVLNNTKPNQDIITYQKALHTASRAMDDLMDHPNMKHRDDLWSDETVGDSEFCQEFAESVNVSGRINCNTKSDYDNPNFISTDGIRFWGFEGKVFNVDGGVTERDVFVDRKLKTKELKTLEKHRDSEHAKPGLRITITYHGRVYVPNDYDFEHSLIEKFGHVK